MNRDAWTGMHGDAAAAAACMRACVVARVIDTMYQLIYSSAQTQAWRMEFSYRNIRKYFSRSKGRARDTVSRRFLIAKNIRDISIRKFDPPRLA
jgi:hypothetical protein